VRPLVCLSQPLAQALRERIAGEPITASTAQELLQLPQNAAVTFVDNDVMAELERVATSRNIPTGDLTLPGPVIAICDGSLETAVSWLPRHAWLSHVVSAAMLNHPMATAHLANVIASLQTGNVRLLDWVRPTLHGRRVMLARSSERNERLDRLEEFFTAESVGARTVQLLRDAAEELLSNAFFDAPLAAGAVAEPMARTLEVSLPEDTACDLVYGCTEDFTIVRVRDPFGALSRTRIVDVLNRREDNVGLWRLMSTVSFVAISVVNGHHTDVLVGIGKRDGNAGPRPFAFHLFFKEGARRRYWSLSQADGRQSLTISNVSDV